MARRGRPKGAQSGKKLTPYVAAWGTPSQLEEKHYAESGRARDKVLSELEEMRRFGERYSHVFRDQIASNIQEVRQAAFEASSRDFPREWRAEDDVSHIVFVVRLWKE